MNKKIIALGCVAAFAATSSIAAMGPGFGLPIGWTMTNTRGYGAQAGLNANPGSAMCVECHSVNPSSHVLDIENVRAYDITRTNITTQGSHAVINDMSSTPLASNDGGGWSDAVAGIRNGSEYVKQTAWANADATAFSKVEDGATAGLQSGLANAIAAGDEGIICESCHSVRFNVLTAADNDLLLDQYQDNTIDTICTSCHGNMDTNGNLKGFDNTTRKNHHVLTGDSLIDDATHYNGGGTASKMWAPYASDSLHANWCAAPYTSPAGVTKLDIAAGEPIAFRGMCNVGGQGTRLFSATIGDIVPTGAAAINCANCHRPHNAMTSAGAFILRSGKQQAAGVLQRFEGNNVADGGSLATGAAAGMNADDATTGMYYGIRRQSDVGAYASAKVYGEYVQLCNGCHVGYNL